MTAEWPEVRLGDVVADVTVGYVSSMTHEYRQAGIPFLRSQDVKPHRIEPVDLKFISRGFHEKIAKSALRPGDVVVVRTGVPGTAAVIPEALPEANCADLVVIRPGPKIVPRYLAYFFNSRAGQHHVRAHTVGAVQQHFNVGAAREARLRLPPLQEQHAVADVLGALDDKIELNRHMNETLEAMARALFTSWFVAFDPVRAKAEGRAPAGMDAATAALFPDRFDESELGEIPRGWRRGTIGSIANVVDCLHSKKPERQETGRPFLQLSNILDSGLMDLSETYLIAEDDYAVWTSRFEASPGDCAITNVGRVGAVAQIPTGFNGALGRNMTGVRCKPETPYPTFLVEVLLSRAMRDEIRHKTDTGTILDALNVRNIPLLRLVLPPVPGMAQFETVGRPLRARMEANHRESLTLATLRDALLPKLLSGELRVRDAEKAVEQVA